MTTQHFIHKRTHHWRLLSDLALVLVIFLGLVLIQPARAATVPPGYVQGWGWNHVGQLNIPADLSDVVAVSASQIHSLALKSNGTVVTWGSTINGLGTVPAGLSGVIAVAAGDGHSLALKSNGTVVAWGTNNYGQINVPSGLSGVIAISAGQAHSLALKNDGTVVGWGRGDYGQITPPAGLNHVIAIDAGGVHSLALKDDGTVVAWGDNTFGELNIPAGLGGVVAISAGDAHNLALKSDGTVVAWGNNDNGQINIPTGLSGVVAVSGGYAHSLALKSDGTVVAWGSNANNAITVPAGLSGVVGIAAGGWHNLVIVPPPSVTVEQAANQGDPATATPVFFTASFSKPVSNFTAADVTLSGTANRADATITVSGGPSVYTIRIDGLVGSGTVLATIPANVATDVNGYGNRASTSTDNSVTVNIVNVSSCIVNAAGTADYTTIQAAVNDPSCTVITVVAGTYPEHVTIARNVTINGAGASSTKVDGTQTGTVFTIQSGAVTLQNLTIAGGTTNGLGGGINNSSALTLNNCTISGNTAPNGVNAGGGGGIQNSVRSSLTINNCLISGNSTDSGVGGAINNDGQLTVNTSTLAGNTAYSGYGGGIRNAGTVTVNNSTLAGNAAGAGGGIFNLSFGKVTVNNSTVVGNSSRQVGGGLWNNSGTMTVVNSIIANNPKGDCNNPISDGGGNLASDDTCSFTAATSRKNINPQLDPAGLKDNGGPTPTIALLPGSPAIGAAVSCPPPTTDQRGIARPQGAACDSGAYELVDQTPPQITPTVVGTQGTNGWYTSDLTINWSVVDPESGVASQTGCDSQNVQSDTTGVAFTCTATSAGGTSSQTLTIKRDATAPTITFDSRTAANGNHWNNSPVTVNWRCSDVTSDVVAASVSKTVSDEGANQSATGSCTDNAGNSASDTQNGINIDKTAPTISAAATTQPNANGWYKGDVTVHFTCTDVLSGLAANACPADQVLSDEGSAVASAAQTITDLAGNTSNPSNVVTVKIDKTPPTISAAATTQPNANGWYKDNVTVHFTCADTPSGLAANACPADQSLSSEGSAVASTAQTVGDLAGNSSAASNVVTVQLDKTAPVVTVTGVSNGASYTLGSVPAAGCTTTDALSGVATQATLSVTGGNPDGTGSFTATCSGATDKAGNSGSASVTYSVGYKWTGFFQPVDNLPTVNTVNAGQAIPVKFSLGGDYGLNIFASGYPASQNVSCGSSGGGSSAPIEETVTAGNSSLQYDPGTQHYIYVWKTDKAWAGTCRTLIVKLIDGTEHTAFFQFNGKARSAAATDEAAVTQQIFLPLVNR